MISYGAWQRMFGGRAVHRGREGRVRRAGPTRSSACFRRWFHPDMHDMVREEEIWVAGKRCRSSSSTTGARGTGGVVARLAPGVDIEPGACRALDHLGAAGAGVPQHARQDDGDARAVPRPPRWADPRSARVVFRCGRTGAAARMRERREPAAGSSRRIGSASSRYVRRSAPVAGGSSDRRLVESRRPVDVGVSARDWRVGAGRRSTAFVAPVGRATVPQLG